MMIVPRAFVLVIAFAAVDRIVAQERGGEPDKRGYDARSLIAGAANDIFRVAPLGRLSFRDPGAGRNRELVRGTDERPNEEFTIALFESGELQQRFAETTISWASGKIWITAPQKYHEFIEKELRHLDVLTRNRIDLDVLVIPLPLLDRIAPQWRESPLHLADDAFEALLADDDAELLSLSGRPAQIVADGAETITAMLEDHEVNQTGVIPVSNPVIGRGTGGLRIEARSLLSADRERILVDLNLGRVDVTRQLSEVAGMWSVLELPIFGEELFSCGVLLKPGQAAVLGSLAENRLAIIAKARLGAHPTSKPPTNEAGLSWRVHDISTLLRNPTVRRWPPLVPPDGKIFDRFFDDVKVIDRDYLVERSEGIVFDPDDENTGVVQFAGGRLHVLASDANHQKIAAIIAAEARPLFRMVAVDIEIVELPRQLLPGLRRLVGANGTLPEDWHETIADGDTSRARYSVVGLTAEVHGLRHAVLRTLVVDVEQVSGGTGFAIVEQSDPISSLCGSGLDLRLRVDLRNESQTAALTLWAEQAELKEVRKVAGRIPALPITSPTGRSDQSIEKDPPVRVIPPFDLELPRQNISEWRITRDVPLGKPTLVRTELQRGAPARLLITRVRELK